MIRIIKNTGPAQRQIDTKAVAKALGAEKVGIKINTKQGPISLFSLRQFLISRLAFQWRPVETATGRTMKKKKVYIVCFIYNETSWSTYGSFDTKKEAEDYITEHHWYKADAPMYIIEAYRYKKNDR